MDTQNDNTDMSTYTKLRLVDLAAVPNWYPHVFPRTKNLQSFRDAYSHLKNDECMDVTESIAGRIDYIRTVGSNLFFVAIESDGIFLQILANKKYYMNQDEFLLNKKILRRGDIIGATGYPTRSTKGELSILPVKITLLAPCIHDIPKYKGGFANDASRFGQRYLDLIMHHPSRDIIKMRAGVYKFIRKYLDDRDFIEVETPILSTKIGGANAQPFITYHNDLNKKMSMRIAPELFLKQLVIGGLERIYELGKQFRNEGIDSTHNPEFTSIEIYQTYADYQTMMAITEEMLSGLVFAMTGSYLVKYDLMDLKTNTSKSVDIDFTPPFQKLDMMADLQKYGNFVFPPEILNDLSSNPNTFRHFLMYICQERNIVCSEPQTIPRLLDKLVSTYLEPLCMHPTFIIGHPQIMSPLAKYDRNNNLLTERFELFVVGRELANAYTELNDYRTQKACFEKQAADKACGDEEAQPTDNNYIRALEYGLPPCGGLGIGIDRLIMLLTNQSAIKEVLTFPPH